MTRMLLFLSAAAAAYASCATEEALLAALGGDCLLASDCDEGLVCIYRRCHEQCKTSADCPPGADGKRARCTVAPTPIHVCQLEIEKRCVYHSDCAGGQACARDAQCRDECVTDRDCVQDQVCRSRTCALSDELGDGGLLPLADTGAPAAGDTCAFDSECKPINADFVCRNGQCDFECHDDVDCGVGAKCAPTPGGGSCKEPSEPYCVPGQQKICDCPGALQAGVQICVDPLEMGYGPCKKADGSSCAAP